MSLIGDDGPAFLRTLISPATVLLLGLIAILGAKLLDESSAVFNIGKLSVLAIFIVGGLGLGTEDWTRLEPQNWTPVHTLIAAGMLGILAYEGFELIANASGDMRDPKRAILIAMIGSVLIAIVIYSLAFIVAIIHLDFAAVSAARDHAVSEAAKTFLGQFGFVMMGVGATLASTSAIGTDYSGASRLPPELAKLDELPSVFQREMKGRSLPSVAAVAVPAVATVMLLDILALSAAASGGFLAVFAAVNLTVIRLRKETGAGPVASFLALILSLAAIALMFAEYITTPGTRDSAMALIGVLVIAAAVEAAYRRFAA